MLCSVTPWGFRIQYYNIIGGVGKQIIVVKGSCDRLHNGHVMSMSAWRARDHCIKHENGVWPWATNALRTGCNQSFREKTYFKGKIYRVAIDI